MEQNFVNDRKFASCIICPVLNTNIMITRCYWTSVVPFF